MPGSPHINDLESIPEGLIVPDSLHIVVVGVLSWAENMSERLSTKLVRVTIEEERPDLFFATSADLKGLFVAKESIEEVLTEIPTSIAALYEVCGEKVIVEHVRDNEHSQFWIAMPAALAESALARLRRQTAA